jgi:hypothetical protein
MFTKFIWIFILQFNCFQRTLSVRYGYEVGGTSMDSTHYDRRIFQEQCPVNNQIKDQRQVIYWSNTQSTLSSTNNSQGNSLVPIRKQFIINRGDSQLITRASSDTIHVNNTESLDIDEASVHIVVEQQVRFLFRRAE